MIDLLSVDFSDYVKVEKLSEQNVPNSFLSRFKNILITC